MNKYTEQLCYIFGDNPDAIRVITSFTSQTLFLKNTVPFKTPLPVNTSSLLGFKRETFVVRNPLERSILEIMRNLGKASLYEYVVESIREHHDKIVFALGILDKAASIDVDATHIGRFIDQARHDFDAALKQFAYSYLISIDENSIREWFASSRSVWDLFENEVVQFVRNMRETSASCCGKYATQPEDGQKSTSKADERPPRKVARTAEQQRKR